MVSLIVAAVLILFALFVAAKTVRIIPQARAGVVERLGRYSRTLSPGMTIVVPFIDRVRPERCGHASTRRFPSRTRTLSSVSGLPSN